MISDIQERKVTMGGITKKAIPFTIKEKNFGVLSTLITDKLYSDKPMAVIREYICNAIDANRGSGQKDSDYRTVSNGADLQGA